MIMYNNTVNKIDNVMTSYLVLYSVYILTMVLGFFGNILIVSTILKNKYLRNPMNISLVSLALCDLMVCAFVLPVRLFLYSGTWDTPYMLVLCQVDVFLKSVCDYAQPSMLVATSYERYKSIAKPFQSKLKMKRIVIVITATWGTCLCCGAVSAILFKDGATLFPCNKDIINAHMSARVLDYREAYVTLPLGFSCIVLVCVFYFLMIRTLHEHTNKMKKRFKANKVHPEPKTEQGTKKETNLDTLTIRPLVDDKIDANLSDNSRQTSGTSVHTSDSLKNSNETLNTNAELNDQLLRTNSLTEKDSHAVIADNNSECQIIEDMLPNNTPRRISIRKTRENILPSNERKGTRRFSTIAKHVVLLKSHKKKSLNNIQSRISKVVSVMNLRNVSSNDQECIKLKQKHTDDKHADKTHTVNAVSGGVKAICSEPVYVSSTCIDKCDAKNELVNCVSAICSYSPEKTKVMPRVIDIQAVLTETNECKIVNKSDDHLYVEPCQEYPDVGELNKKSSEEKNWEYARKADISEAGSSKTCHTKDDTNDANLSKSNDIKENENIRVNIKESQLQSEHGTGISENQNNKNDSQEETKNVSKIDIVDFYGTVHKDVKVEGAVVGAVCVMNTANRLEGRRKVEMRAAKRIAVLIGSFVLLWLPLPLITLFVSSRRQISTSDIEALLTSASISATTIAFNPILNLLLNKQLRSAALTVLRRAVNALKRIRLR